MQVFNNYILRLSLNEIKGVSFKSSLESFISIMFYIIVIIFIKYLNSILKFNTLSKQFFPCIVSIVFKYSKKTKLAHLRFQCSI